jgi:cation:H+ antiporter
MLLASSSVILGLILLVWSADRFVEGSASAARHFGMSPLLIGMLIVGFGTSAPEITVSAIAAIQGNPEIAIGNAYGSNITNIGLILGITALISPIRANSQIIKKELPILTVITALALLTILDLNISRFDSAVLLSFFILLVGWSIRQGMNTGKDDFGKEVEQELGTHAMPLKKSMFWIALGLIFLIISSRMLVWGAVEIARSFGVSDLIIGLTVIAVGTSLPELASSIIAARKGEHDMALGNVLGSNMFNTLAVVGVSGLIAPFSLESEVLTRDMPVMAALTLSLFLIVFRPKGPGRVNRFEGGLLLTSYTAYTAYLIRSTF